ncbi:MAG: class I SAM-dependent methyltransferase [Candidatus Nanohaloarchaea archaeon]
MDEHIIDPAVAEKLEDESRYRYVSREELLEHVDPGDTVVEIGSGTGFFTDDLASKAKKVYAVDLQEEMHQYYRDKGVPENVELIQSRASELEVEHADTIFSIFSFHELDVAAAVKNLAEVIDDGELVVFDWSRSGSGDHGPPPNKRFSAETAAEKVSEHFDVEEAVEREDSFKLVAKTR